MAYYTTKSHALFFTTFMAFSCTMIMGENVFPSSTISAAPALLPDPISPSSSPPPSLSPEINPVFPSPGGPQLAPSDSTPLIPSSPSPPNPDEYASEGPGAAFPPSGMLPVASSEGRRAEVLLCSAAVALAGFWMN